MTKPPTRTRTAKVTTAPAVVETPALISPQAYLQDLRTRVSIHNREFTALVRDVFAAGQRAHEAVDAAVAEVRPVIAPVLARVRR